MITLKIPSKEAAMLLNEKIGEIEQMVMKGQVLDYYDFIGWSSGIWSVIDDIYGADNYHPEEIRSLGFPSCSCKGSMDEQQMQLEMYHSRLVDYLNEIQAMDDRQVN